MERNGSPVQTLGILFYRAAVLENKRKGGIIMLHLDKVTSQNVWKLLALRVSEDQTDFVATNTESIVEA